MADVKRYATLEPGFGSAIVVLVALFVLWVIATNSWTKLSLAWQELWETGDIYKVPGMGEPPASTTVPPAGAARTSNIVAWTPAIAGFQMNALS